VSELASWLYSNDLPVEIVAANRLAESNRNGSGPRANADDAGEVLADATLRITSGLDGACAQGPDVLAMGYRMRRVSPRVVHAFDLGDASAARIANAPFVVSFDGVPYESRSATNRTPVVDSMRTSMALAG